MKIEIKVTNPGRTLLALATARTAVSTRWSQLVNCSSCKEEDKERYHQALSEIDALIKQIKERL